MDRWVIPPKRITSPIRRPRPPYKYDRSKLESSALWLLSFLLLLFLPLFPQWMRKRNKRKMDSKLSRRFADSPLLTHYQPVTIKWKVFVSWAIWITLLTSYNASRYGSNNSWAQPELLARVSVWQAFEWEPPLGRGESESVGRASHVGLHIVIEYQCPFNFQRH